VAVSWDPAQYERFAAERARPFHDLVAQIPTPAPAQVVDLGCGPGIVTATLADRWPDARVVGIDSSPEMVTAARALSRPGRLDFEAADIADWRPVPGSVDVIVSNAALQWVAGHAALLPVWAAALSPGGTLAIQVPVSRDIAAMEAVRAVAAAPRWADRLAAVAAGVGPRSVSPVLSGEAYLDVLARVGLAVNAWETTYLHVLHGDDPVLEWFAGTGLRPYLTALAGDPAAAADFRTEVAERLRERYPARPYGTVLPFPRLFVVGTRA
jgi:trans-aconitate 2-methyltransferase